MASSPMPIQIFPGLKSLYYHGTWKILTYTLITIVI